MKSVILTATLLVFFSATSFAHADTIAAPIGNPYTDTIQLWSRIADSVNYIAQETATAAHGAVSVAEQLTKSLGQTYPPVARANSQQQTASLAEAVVSFETPTTTSVQTAATTATTDGTSTFQSPGSPQAISASSTNLPTLPLSNPTPAFNSGTFVTQDELTQQLLALSSVLTSTLNANSASALTVPAWAPSQAIDQLNNVTITNANLTASEIPALNYFPATNTVSVAYGGTGVSIPSVVGFPVKSYGATGNGTADDTSAIQSAINAACAANGGRVVFGARVYLISSTINITCSNVFLVGRGAPDGFVGSPSAYTGANRAQGSTVIEWGGATNGTMIDFNPANDGPALVGGGISGMVLAGYGVAGTGLEMQSMAGGSFPSLVIENTTENGVLMTISTSTITGDSSNNKYDTIHNTFGRLSIVNDWNIPAVNNATGISLEGDETYNACYNVFDLVNVIRANGIGMDFQDSDDNVVQTLTGFQPNGDTGSLVQFEASNATTSQSAARANTIVFMNGSATAMANGATASNDNTIDTFSVENGVALPAIQSGATLSYSTNNGATYVGSNLVVTAAGNVGIGTTTPQYALNIAGNINGVDNALVLENDNANGNATNNLDFRLGNHGVMTADVSNGFQSGEGQYLAFGAGTPASEIMRLTSSSGYVGIGSTTPATTLSVAGSAYFTGGLGVGVLNTTSGTFQISGSGTIGGNLIVSGTQASLNQGSTTLLSSLGPSYFGATATSTFASNGVLSLVSNGLNVGTGQLIVSSGNVGIGTTTPNYPLHIVGNAGNSLSMLTLENVNNSAQATEDFDFRLGNHGYMTAYVRNGFLSGEGQYLALGAGQPAGEVMRLTGNGTVGIGTTSPSSRLSVWGTDTGSSTLAFNVVNSASTTEFAVFDGGNAQLSGTLSQNSDERLKTNIESLNASSSLSLINALTPVTFNWIDPNRGTGLQLGFIAQEVLPLFPNLVSTTSPTSLTPDGTLSLNYIGLISPIVSAIQALSSELTSLENTVAGFADQFTTTDLTYTRATGTNLTLSQELCIDQSDGTPVCVTGNQLAAVLASVDQSGTSDEASNAISSNDSQATNTPPVIRINGDNPAIVQVGASYQDLGATVTGPQQDLNLGITTYVNGVPTSPVQIETSIAATDTIDYVVTDQNGLASTSTRTVIVETSLIVPSDDASSSQATVATTTDATSTAQ